MKTKLVYICEKCRKESEDKVDIIICEAQHLGLTAIQKREYDKLIDEAKRCSFCEGRNRNKYTMEATDEAIKNVIDFEEKYNMKMAIDY